MGELWGLFIFLGIVLVGLGIFVYKNPDIFWKYSLSRRWFLKGGEPTEFYYSTQKIGAVFYVLFGIVMIIGSISMSVTEAKGYVVEIDGSELKIPCVYSDVEALGYHIDASETIDTLRATNKNLKNSVSYVVKNAEGKEITIMFENRGSADKVATDCELVAITVRDENGPKIKLPNGVKSGMSERDIESIMGKGTPKGIAGSAAEFRTSVNFDSYKVNVVYDGNFMNKKAISIRVEDVIY